MYTLCMQKRERLLSCMDSLQLFRTTAVACATLPEHTELLTTAGNCLALRAQALTPLQLCSITRVYANVQVRCPHLLAGIARCVTEKKDVFSGKQLRRVQADLASLQMHVPVKQDIRRKGSECSPQPFKKSRGTVFQISDGLAALKERAAQR